MLNTFFSRRIHWVFALLSLLLLVFLKWGLLFLLLLFYFFIRFLFRRERNLMIQSAAPTTPIRGQVLSVSKNPQTILMKMSWWKGYGCYLPCSGEVVERAEKGFILRDEQGDLWKLEFYPGPWGFLPQIFVLSGDKGKAGGNIGFISGGGTLVLYLPKNYEILVKENDSLELGKTQLAKRTSPL